MSVRLSPSDEPEKVFVVSVDVAKMSHTFADVLEGVCTTGALSFPVSLRLPTQVLSSTPRPRSRVVEEGVACWAWRAPDA